MATLGERIRDLRESKDIPQREFAKKIGISNVVLSRYESGDRKPDYEVLKKIADYFSVTTDWLLGHSVENTRTIRGEQVDISQLTEQQRTVLDWIMSRDSFQTVENKDDLTKLLDEVGVIYDLIHKREK